MTPEQFQRHISKEENVSRETFLLFEQWLGLLTHWNKRINLVSAPTIYNFWSRHALDSWQLVELLPKGTKTVLDMGAGAGFPGLAMAIALKGRPDCLGAQITLVESNGKKCNFLRTVIRELALPAKVVQCRAENLEPKNYDIITARAFAPLPELLGYSLPFFSPDTLAIFPKGENWQSEVTAARKTHTFDLTTKDSQTSEAAKILCITNLQRT